MIPEARCIHGTKGRLRLTIPAAKGNGGYFSHLLERFAECPSVSNARANPLIGSVLISHGGEEAEIIRFAEANGLFRLSGGTVRKNPGGLAKTTIATYKSLDAQIRRFSGGELDLPHTTFLALVGAGIYQISRGNFGAPAWYTAFWYALNIFLKAQTRKEMNG